MQPVRWLLMAVAGSFLTSAAVQTAEPASPLRAAAHRVDITPSRPVTLSGYASRKGLSQGVHDPLSARAVAFEHDGNQLVLVSLDNIGFYGGVAAELRRVILEACDLDPAELWLCAIHTHSAPTLTFAASTGHPHNAAYSQNLKPILIKLVQTVLAQLQPVEVSALTGSSPVGVNRRERVLNADGSSSIKLGRNPSGAMDHEVQLVAVRKSASAPVQAALFGYASHSTSLGPRNYQISGDIHGLAEQFVERHFDERVVAPAFAGASGDVDPWYRVLPNFRRDPGWIPETVLMGTMLGVEVVHLLEKADHFTSTGPVRSVQRSLDLPGRVAEDTQREPSTRPLELSIGRVGPIAFVGLGGEIFNEIGAAIKRASPAALTFIITHCNGAAGYVPTRQSYPEGGYEIRTSPFAPGADEQLTREAVSTLHQLFSNQG